MVKEHPEKNNRSEQNQHGYMRGKSDFWLIKLKDVTSRIERWANSRWGVVRFLKYFYKEFTHMLANKVIAHGIGVI